ncbi:putative holin-like toxin [Limosilactobacillus portuensis]
MLAFATFVIALLTFIFSNRQIARNNLNEFSDVD